MVMMLMAMMMMMMITGAHEYELVSSIQTFLFLEGHEFFGSTRTF